MRFLNSWASDDRRTLISFSEAVLETFERNIQFGETDREAGGVLLGTVHGSHMQIQQATLPTSQDKRFRHRFERMPFGHKTIAASRWNTSQGEIRYLGEWHTHPEDIPHPSLLDQFEWKRLAEKRLDRRSMLAVIVGRGALHVEIVSGLGISTTLLPVE